MSQKSEPGLTNRHFDREVFKLEADTHTRQSDVSEIRVVEPQICVDNVVTEECNCSSVDFSVSPTEQSVDKIEVSEITTDHGRENSANVQECNKVKISENQSELIFKTRPISEYEGKINVRANPAKGLYILATFQKEDTIIPIKILLDTGSNHSLMNQQIYDQIPDHMKPPLQHTGKQVKFADGSTQRGIGMISMSMNLDKKSNINFLIGNYSDDAIMGMDDMRRLGLTINAGNMLVSVGDKWLPVHDGQNTLIGRKVLVRRTTIIPAKTQVLVPAYIEDYEQQFILPNKPVLLNTNDNIIGDFGVLPARSIHQEPDREVFKLERNILVGQSDVSVDDVHVVQPRNFDENECSFQIDPDGHSKTADRNFSANGVGHNNAIGEDLLPSMIFESKPRVKIKQ